MIKKVVQFGAGSIGRGFLGQLFSESGYEIVFVEAREDLVNKLNQDNRYRLRIVGKNARELLISNVRAVKAQDTDGVAREIEDASLLATAVGARNLPAVAILVAAGIRQRAKKEIGEPIDLIICENLPQAAKIFQGYLEREIGERYLPYLNTNLGLVETVVTRMVPLVPPELAREDLTLVLAEDYKRLPVNKKGFKGELPHIEGMIFSDNLIAYSNRKLFTDNTCHALLSYLGYLKKYQFVWQAVEDQEIRKQVRAGLKESAQGLIKKYGFPPEEQTSHTENFLERVANKDLQDTIARLGRDPLRKLAPQDRLVGAARLAENYGKVKPENLARGIAAALFFDQKGDEEAAKLSQMRHQEGIEAIVKKICQIDSKEVLGQMILKFATQIQSH